MAIPTTSSTSNDLEKKVELINKAVIAAYGLCSSWKTRCAAGDVSRYSIMNDLFVPIAQEYPYGIWRTVRELSSNALRNVYAAFLERNVEITSVKAAADELAVDNHSFSVDDPVFLKGVGDAPGGLTKGTTYYIVAIDGNDIQVSATESGTAIDLSVGDFDGNLNLILDMSDTWTTLRDALEDVLDEIDTVMPVSSSDLRLVRTDKSLLNSTTGLRELVLTSTETADLQTALQAVVDAIQAPI